MKSWVCGPMMKLMSLKEEEERAELVLSPSCENTARGQPSTGQEKGSHQELTLLVSWYWTSQALDPWETNSGCLSHLVYGILLQQLELTKAMIFPVNCPFSASIPTQLTSILDLNPVDLQCLSDPFFFLVLPLTSCTTLGKLLNLYNGNNNNLFRGFYDTI